MLTDWMTQYYEAPDLLMQHCLEDHAKHTEVLYAWHGRTLHNTKILISQIARACCMKEYHQNWCCHRSMHYALELLLGAAQGAFTCVVS